MSRERGSDRMHDNVIGFEGGVEMHLHLSGTLMPLAVLPHCALARAAQRKRIIKFNCHWIILHHLPGFSAQPLC